MMLEVSIDTMDSWNLVRSTEFSLVKATALLSAIAPFILLLSLRIPKKYFTEEVMEKLDWAAGQEYYYGSEKV